MKLAETLVAAAIAFVLSWTLLRLAHDDVATAAHLDARVTARTATDRLAERLTSDAASAWSVFVPATDVLGESNADAHELDFVTEDASHRTYWWAYDFNAATQRVTDYAYAPGAAAVAGDVFAGISTFITQLVPVTDLSAAGSPAYDALLAGTGATAVSFDYGFLQPLALGGNGIARVTIAAAGVNRTLSLVTNTAPTHFTVVVKYTPAP